MNISSKNGLIVLLLGCTLMFSACATDDGDDSNPLESKPSITIISPDNIQSPNDSNQILLNVKYQDQIEMLSTTLVLTASAISGAPYYTDTRALNGTSDEINMLVNLSEINLLGSHRLTVSANNDLGNQELTDFDFELVDLSDPQINVIEFYSDLPGGAGTPHSKFNVSISDNYALKKVTLEIYRTDASGNEINSLFLKEESFSTFKRTYTYDSEFQISGAASSGDHYIGKITVNDQGGNTAQYVSAVKRYL